MKTIDYTAIKALIAESKPVVCIDVRADFRYATFDAGGLKIPYNKIKEYEGLLAPHRDATIVVCCMRAKGSQSTVIAARALSAMGFQDVRELEKGMYNGWVIQRASPKENMPDGKTISTQ